MTSDQSLISSRQTSLRMIVVASRARSIAELTTPVRHPKERNLSSSSRIGKDKHSPTIGRYRRCSKMTSLIGKKLDVGARVIKNHSMEKEAIGCRLRNDHAKPR